MGYKKVYMFVYLRRSVCTQDVNTHNVRSSSGGYHYQCLLCSASNWSLFYIYDRNSILNEKTD